MVVLEGGVVIMGFGSSHVLGIKKRHPPSVPISQRQTIKPMLYSHQREVTWITLRLAGSASVLVLLKRS
jgi:hypothetical protein